MGKDMLYPNIPGQGGSRYLNHSIIFLVVAIILIISNINCEIKPWFCLCHKSVKSPFFTIIENEIKNKHISRYLPLHMGSSKSTTTLFIFCFCYSQSCHCHSQLQAIAQVDQIPRRNAFPSPFHICKSYLLHEDQVLSNTFRNTSSPHYLPYSTLILALITNITHFNDSLQTVFPCLLTVPTVSLDSITDP